MTGPKPWREAMQDALYGPAGFYLNQTPDAHFDTSAQLPPFGEAIAEVVRRIDFRLGHPARFTLVDMGAGRGELLDSVLRNETLNGRLHPIAVEIRQRPTELDPRISWQATPPSNVVGLIIACEWLDNIPLDVAIADDQGIVSYQLVDTDGATRVGSPVSDRDADWLKQWWPIGPGETAELGQPRDTAWQQLCRSLKLGTAMAIDYGHLRNARPMHGTMTSFVSGRQVPPILDGSADITAHVAVDSLREGTLLTQREALQQLGFDAKRPALEQSSRDPMGYLHALNRASTLAQLTEPSGLGAHWWLTVDK